MKRVAINGMGREGRSILRQFAQTGSDELTIVAANDLMTPDNVAYLLKYDSTYGPCQQAVSVADGELSIGDHTLRVFSEPDPQRLPWNDLDIDIVIDCSGKFTHRNDAQRHIDAGARRVLIAAPAPDADVMLVMGVNESAFDPQQHTIISNASCTTNSLAPPLKLLHDNFGIDYALVTTIHSYTASQAMVDSASKKVIRGRAGAVNIIPTATGADTATVAVLPELEGRLTALAVRVPVVNGSMTDISLHLTKETSAEQINQLFKEASEGALGNIIGYTEEPLVSSDIIGNPHSCIVHSLSTRVLGGSAVKLQLWYDNEFAYAKRCLDMVELLPLG